METSNHENIRRLFATLPVQGPGAVMEKNKNLKRLTWVELISMANDKEEWSEDDWNMMAKEIVSMYRALWLKWNANSQHAPQKNVCESVLLYLLS